MNRDLDEFAIERAAQAAWSAYWCPKEAPWSEQSTGRRDTWKVAIRAAIDALESLRRGACPGWNPDGSFDPDRCWADDHEAEKVCHCTWCGDPGEAGCCACNHSDVYEPCPVLGYGCGIGATGPRTCDCCTDEQWAAGAIRGLESARAALAALRGEQA